MKLRRTHAWLASGALVCTLVATALGAPQAADEGSPLIDALYQASRQEKDKDAEPFLERAQALLTPGVDVGAVDRDRRTALHWAVIGAMSRRKQPQLRAYQDLVGQLIERGSEVNAEDSFSATPLDYQENSSATELTFQLLDSGARNGSAPGDATRLKALLDTLASASQAGDLVLIRSALASDLPIGTRLQVRLTGGLSTNRSRAGDVIEAVLTAPVALNGRMVLPARTGLRGTVMLSQKAANDYERAQLVVTFTTLLHPDGQRTQVSTRLVDVDNAKETVQAGRIIGLPFPSISRVRWALRALSVSDPVLSDALHAALLVRDKEYKRAVEYPPGTDMTLTIEHPAKLSVLPPDDPVAPAPPPAALVALVGSQPLRTEATGGTPSDLTNLLFIGSREQVAKAFHAAGWSDAAAGGLRPDLKTFAAVAESRGYRNAPVSLLLLDGRKPDAVYQRQTDTFAKRHHIRLWRASAPFEDTDVWVAAATHDIGVAVQKGGREWFHRIDTHVDRERAKVANDLEFAGAVDRRFLVDRPGAPREAQNATGERIVTDGRMAVLFLR